MGIEFSVIVPVYKVEKYLAKCIDSILAQSFEDFELLLIDDGSPDNCPQICDMYAQRDARIHVIHKENGGLVSARNVGIRAAKGNYICYVDGDDWIDKNLLEMVYNAGIKDHRADMVIFGIVKKFLDRDEVILTDLTDGVYEKKQLESDVYPYMMYDNRKPFCKPLIFPAACNKVYSRELLIKHYCKDERIRMGEDNAFVYECAWYSNKICICNKVLYFYNQLNPGAMNQTYDANRFINNRYLFEYMEERLSGKDMVLDCQLNAFKAYWVTMAVFHEVKNRRPFIKSVRHVRKQIQYNQSLKGICVAELPKTAAIFIIMLRFKLYAAVLLGARVLQLLR